MTKEETEILHRLVRWADFCAGEGIFQPGEDDPSDILYDWFQLDGDVPDCWPEDVKKNWSLA